MAKIKPFEISSFLNNDSQPEAVTETTNEINIKMISVYDLVPHPDNFYKTDTEIEKIANEIEAQGNITPLDVKKIENNKYMIISGHRRRKAILHLLSGNEYKNDKVPCVIREYADEMEEQAAIVFANSQRVKDDDELSEEVERARPYIERRYKAEREKAKAEGKEFPKFRKYFADKLGVSETTIHREESYKKVAEEIKEEVKAGNTTKTAVAEIASMPKEQQKKVYEAAKDDSGRVSVKAIQEQKENLRKLEHEGQTVIPDCKIEATTESGNYKEEFIKKIDIKIHKKFGELIILIAHDPNDNKYRAGCIYRGKTSGMTNTPSTKHRPYSTEQEAIDNTIKRLQESSMDGLAEGLAAAGYTKDKPKTITANIQIAEPGAGDKCEESAKKNFIDLMQKEIETAAKSLIKASAEEREHIEAFIKKLGDHLEFEQGAGI